MTDGKSSLKDKTRIRSQSLVVIAADPHQFVHSRQKPAFKMGAESAMGLPLFRRLRPMTHGSLMLAVIDGLLPGCLSRVPTALTVKLRLEAIS